MRFVSPQGLWIPSRTVSSGVSAPEQWSGREGSAVLEALGQFKEVVDLGHRTPRIWSTAALIDCIVVVDPPRSGWLSFARHRCTAMTSSGGAVGRR